MFGASRVSRASISASTVAGSALTPLARSSSQRRRARSANEAVTKSFADALGKMTVPIVAAIQHRTSLGGEGALKIQQRGTHARDRSDGSRGHIGHGSAQVFPIQVGRLQCTCLGLGGGGIRRISASVQHAAADRAIQEAGIEVGQSKRRGNAPCQRALAGGRGPVDRNDGAALHAGDSAAPTRFISSMKPGKLVSMMPASSTVTGCSVAAPSTSAGMAMR